MNQRTARTLALPNSHRGGSFEVIPAQAVEAAAKALRDKYADEVCELPVSSFLGDAKTALEAAAPYMLNNEGEK